MNGVDGMNADLSELLSLLRSHHVKFLVIGAHAVAFHHRPRMTQDVDLWVGPSSENATRLRNVLREFGADIGVEGAVRFSSRERQMIRLGIPPNMIDILNFAGTLPFDEVYRRRVEGTLNGETVFFPAKEDLIEMKLASGRPQDVVDARSLES